MNSIFKFLNGQEYCLDGIHGTFKHDCYMAHYPYPHTVEKLYHEPSNQGQQTKAYQEIKAKLGDNWTSDLTEAIDRYCDIATNLGYK